MPRCKPGTARIDSASVILVLLVLGVPAALPALSSPDGFEGSPWFDDTSTSTLNVLTFNTVEPQPHTLHTDNDVDWGVAASITDGPLVPFSLRFSNLTVPSGSAIQVDLFEDGPTHPATQTEYIQEWVSLYSVTWLTSGINPVYFAIRPVNTAAPAMAYDLEFFRDTGNSNGRARPVEVGTLRVEWIYATPAPSGAKGFAVFRSETGQSDTFVCISPNPIPIPSELGATLFVDDGGLNSATVYYYRVRLIAEDDSETLYEPTFSGYVPPVASPTPTPVSPEDASGCIVY